MAVATPIAATGAAAPSFLIFGGATTGTSGTRYVYPGYNASGTASSLKRMRIGANCTAVRLDMTNGAGGTGSGSFTFNLVTVSGDVATTTGLSLTVSPDARTGSATGSVAITAGQEIAIQIIISGTVTSPADFYITLTLQ